MTPDLAKPPPDRPKQPYRVQATAIIPAYSQADATDQFRLAIRRIGGQYVGGSASAHIEGGKG